MRNGGPLSHNFFLPVLVAVGVCEGHLLLKLGKGSGLRRNEVQQPYHEGQEHLRMVSATRDASRTTGGRTLTTRFKTNPGRSVARWEMHARAFGCVLVSAKRSIDAYDRVRDRC